MTKQIEINTIHNATFQGSRVYKNCKDGSVDLLFRMGGRPGLYYENADGVMVPVRALTKIYNGLGWFSYYKKWEW